MQRIKDICDCKDSRAPGVRDALIMRVTHGQAMDKRELNDVLAGLMLIATHHHISLSTIATPS